ncbi:MFS transporter [Aaosphaeria arxii CBS 175.79]|uniref:MFS transporter n=1 Tax=Aaosphaeria arxii CBS 175.79 TaxID=1450172 RepID=A0A6A5XI92_9PLEO|nr:MFS transporter [Aaosphaeria arxii CBS 175.79]KAF2012541.1 MFS transporter [Aaosphaeria arxii CBS 175.79]
MGNLPLLKGAGLRAAIVGVCGWCFCLLGYDQGVLGSLIGLPAFLSALGNPTAAIQGLVTAIYSIGCVLGCIVAAFFGLRLGRRWCIMGGCVFVSIGGAGQAAVYSLAQMIVFRIIAGIGTGMISSTVPVWISEICGPKKRGQKTALQLTLVLTGNVIAYWLEYGTTQLPGDVSFRFPIAFQCLFPLVAFIILLGLPESPRILYYWNQGEAADEVLSRLHGYDSFLESSPVVSYEKQQILESIELENSLKDGSSITWRDVFWDNSPIRNSRRLFIVVVLQGLQQLGGCNVIAYYQTTLFTESIGLDDHRARLLAGCSALCFWTGTLPAIYLIEKIGRRQLMLWGAGGCTVAMLAFTILLALGTDHAGQGWGAVAMIFLFEFIYGSSWASTVWIYSAEISPLRFRHFNSGMGVLSQWAMTFLTVMMAPPAIASIGWKTYILFVVFTSLQIPFVYFLCPETAGRTLEELDQVFMKSAPPDVLHGVCSPSAGPIEKGKANKVKLDELSATCR